MSTHENFFLLSQPVSHRGKRQIGKNHATGGVRRRIASSNITPSSHKKMSLGARQCMTALQNVQNAHQKDEVHPAGLSTMRKQGDTENAEDGCPARRVRRVSWGDVEIKEICVNTEWGPDRTNEDVTTEELTKKRKYAQVKERAAKKMVELKAAAATALTTQDDLQPLGACD
tara:strand:- start:1820 stop:2335 length:516 start_codon:yes stop_codon:yes gene_type:complete